MPSRRSRRALSDLAGDPVTVRTVRVRTWPEFLRTLERGRFADWAFRGQPGPWPLSTSLARRLTRFRVGPRAWRAQEERVLRIFRRKARNHLAHVPPDDDHFQWLALMEHHGAPTRLLDFTWSPYVAAFFALESATGDAAVWAVDPRRVIAAACRDAGAETVDPRRPVNFVARFLDGRRPFVWIGEPETMNARLVAQSGTFVLPSVLDRPVDAILAADPATADAIVRFLLPADTVRDRALRELYAMNITHATLFPDLDGLARSLAYELEFHWAYDPHDPEAAPEPNNDAGRSASAPPRVRRRRARQ